MRMLEYWRKNWKRENGWLLALEVVLVLVLAGLVVLSGIGVKNIMQRPLPVEVYIGVPRPEIEMLLIPGVRLHETSIVTKADGSKKTVKDESVYVVMDVYLDNPTDEQLKSVIKRHIPWLGLYAVVLVVLLRIVHTARRDPFSASNILWLRLLGGFVIVAAHLCGYWEALALFELSCSVTNGDCGSYFNQYDWVYSLLAALALLGVSQLIRRGMEIRSELDEVI